MRVLTLAALFVILIAGLPAAETATPEKAKAEPTAFESPEAAWKGLVEAMKADNLDNAKKILGDEVLNIINREPDEPEKRKATTAQMEKIEVIVKYLDEKKERAVFQAGKRDSPFIVEKTARGWVFHMDAEKMKEQREAVLRTSCANNLSQIGKGCMMYADVPDHAECFPTSLDQLYPDYIRDLRCFQCPSVPAGKHRKGAGEVKECDYILLPGLKDTDAILVLAFSRKADHGGKGRNVLVGGGAVEWMDDDEKFKTAVLDTLKQLKISLELPATADLKPLTDEEKTAFGKCISALASEDFNVRADAAKKLEAAGERGRALLAVGVKAEDQETRACCQKLIHQLDQAQEKSGWLKELRAELGLDEKPADAKR
ncbi:MAG: DUF2950 family protein [Planctomycetes bacterium]|nr:DUF2950 family protein [Planctomycetota bacterium]